MFFSLQPTKVTFIDDGIQIHGMHGDVYAWDSIKDARLMEELPPIQLKTKGSELGSNLKEVLREGIVIFNTANEDEIQKIYDEMLKKIK